MVDGLDALALDKILMSDGDFNIMLESLKNLLERVVGEFNQELDGEAISRLCKFRYSIQADFDGYSSWTEMFNREDPKYIDGLNAFNLHLHEQFKLDYSSRERTDIKLSDRDYGYMLKSDVVSSDDIFNKRDGQVDKMHESLDIASEEPDAISEVYGSNDENVRYLNAVDMDVLGSVVDMFAADDRCHLFVKNMDDDGNSSLYEYRFNIPTGIDILNKKLQYIHSGGASRKFTFKPSLTTNFMYDICDDDWIFKMANRKPFEGSGTEDRSGIDDAYLVHCKDNDKEVNLWWLSSIDAYLHGESPILDVAYE